MLTIGQLMLGAQFPAVDGGGPATGVVANDQVTGAVWMLPALSTAPLKVAV
jgi:hypothetical protein